MKKTKEIFSDTKSSVSLKVDTDELKFLIDNGYVFKSGGQYLFNHEKISAIRQYIGAAGYLEENQIIKFENFGEGGIGSYAWKTAIVKVGNLNYKVQIRQVERDWSEDAWEFKVSGTKIHDECEGYEESLEFAKEKIQEYESEFKKSLENKNFKIKKINETGEWPKDLDWLYVKNHPEDEEQESNWIRRLADDLEYIIDEVQPINMEIVDIQGFDLYQGPYAIINIEGKQFKVWTTGYYELFIEDFPVDNTSEEGLNPGFQGEKEMVIDAIKMWVDDKKQNPTVEKFSNFK